MAERDYAYCKPHGLSGYKKGSQVTWYVRTHGVGNNVAPFASFKARINEWQGPKIFNYVDQQMRAYIEANR